MYWILVRTACLCPSWNRLINKKNLRGPSDLMSPVNEFHEAEAYLKYLGHIHLPILEIKKTFVYGDDVSEFHEVNFDTQSAPLLVCMWFHVDDGKISSNKIVFDPRPFLREQRARWKYARFVKTTIYQQTVDSDYRRLIFFKQPSSKGHRERHWSLSLIWVNCY